MVNEQTEEKNKLLKEQRELLRNVNSPKKQEELADSIAKSNKSESRIEALRDMENINIPRRGDSTASSCFALVCNGTKDGRSRKGVCFSPTNKNGIIVISESLNAEISPLRDASNKELKSIQELGIKATGTDLLDIKYDEFKDYTVVKTLKMDASPLFKSVEFIYIFLGKINTVGGYSVVFCSESSDWEYLESHDFDCIVDGERISIGEGKHDGTVGRGYILEFLNYELSRDFLEKLSNSTNAKCRISFRKFDFGDSARTAIKQLLNYTK